uniref:Uncharacterized protein n=1 Tax=Poecilia reticulata TaxID=8081 RepID=A0A3P9PLR2_POERE
TPQETTSCLLCSSTLSFPDHANNKLRNVSSFNEVYINESVIKTGSPLIVLFWLFNTYISTLPQVPTCPASAVTSVSSEVEVEPAEPCRSLSGGRLLSSSKRCSKPHDLLNIERCFGSRNTRSVLTGGRV